MNQADVTLSNTRATANLLTICTAVIRDMTGNELSGAYMKELESDLALELNNAIQEKAQ